METRRTKTKTAVRFEKIEGEIVELDKAGDNRDRRINEHANRVAVAEGRLEKLENSVGDKPLLPTLFEGEGCVVASIERLEKLFSEMQDHHRDLAVRHDLLVTIGEGREGRMGELEAAMAGPGDFSLPERVEDLEGQSAVTVEAVDEIKGFLVGGKKFSRIAAWQTGDGLMGTLGRLRDRTDSIPAEPGRDRKARKKAKRAFRLAEELSADLLRVEGRVEELEFVPDETLEKRIETLEVYQKHLMAALSPNQHRQAAGLSTFSPEYFPGVFEDSVEQPNCPETVLALREMVTELDKRVEHETQLRHEVADKLVDCAAKNDTLRQVRADQAETIGKCKAELVAVTSRYDALRGADIEAELADLTERHAVALKSVEVIPKMCEEANVLENKIVLLEEAGDVLRRKAEAGEVDAAIVERIEAFVAGSGTLCGGCVESLRTEILKYRKRGER